MTVYKDWHLEAIDLHKSGFSSRQIANTLGKGKSSVNDLLVKWYKEKPQQKVSIEKKGPRILIYDIETAPITAFLWSMWQQGVGLNQVESDWFVMSFCAKWLGEDEVFYYDQRDEPNMEDDSRLCTLLWELFNEADIVVGQNIKSFDNKKMNARFILNGLPKPSTYRSIDTLTIAKENFAFTSRKLEYMAKELCPEHVKDGHNEYPGFELWAACLKGDRKAWSVMEKYNKDDVLATESLYNVLSSWDARLPNFDIYVDDVLDMNEWEHDGFHYSNLGKYKRYRNKVTGVQRRSRVNELSKEKRDSLLVNIV